MESRKTRLFKVGDKVRIDYEYDGCPINGKVGTVTWVNVYNYYPNGDRGDYETAEERQQGEITYPEGHTIGVPNMLRKGCGILSSVELVEPAGGRTLDELRKLWGEFSEVPIDNEDRIERGFMGFRKGTDRFEVWHWFDDQCPHGLVEDIIH